MAQAKVEYCVACGRRAPDPVRCEACGEPYCGDCAAAYLDKMQQCDCQDGHETEDQ